MTDEKVKERAPLLVNVTIEVEMTRIDALLCAAFEGGSTYWCERIEVVGDFRGEYAHEQLTHGGQIEVWHSYDEGPIRLWMDDLAKGLRLLHRQYPGHWKDFMDENEDSDTGDIFFQLCTFGEVVYG